MLNNMFTKYYRNLFCNYVREGPSLSILYINFFNLNIKKKENDIDIKRKINIKYRYIGKEQYRHSISILDQKNIDIFLYRIIMPIPILFFIVYFDYLIALKRAGYQPFFQLSTNQRLSKILILATIIRL